MKDDVIEPSSSPWASPIVFVRKKDGSTTFCVDYRRLNDVTKDSYPLPRIDDTLDTLASNTWFSTLNLKSGYWQVELHPNDKEKTAFTTGQLWQFKVMPFCLCTCNVRAPYGNSPRRTFAYPEIGKQFILNTDASHESIGAVLSQEIDGQERVIAYFSQYVSKPERNCMTRKELLAIVNAVEHFHPCLYGRNFLLRTEHASLTWLLNFKNLEGQIARWTRDYRSMTWKFATEKDQHTEMQTPFREDTVLRASNTARESKRNLVQ
ncbi:hypothetical protein TNCV_2045441 [Trichonephila clavipes]|uniref:Reverse transcriptase RNase H-like domain-containing protein n=1 Tax=Trichonephila clavipes TaxID=2585209 RepID=A0A8X6STU8_TRICX|nr:hypothetical protein TNCV_2045441 [Trichonephila clavipes]